MSKSRSRLAADWFAKLRVNAQTQEVEHEDVASVKEEVDTTVTTEIATLENDKADVTYIDTAIANIDLSVKADASYVDSEMAALDSEKADLSYVNTKLGTKADTSYVNTELNKKSDTTYVNTQLSSKADTSYVNTQLDTKANASTTYTETEVNNLLNTKANASTTYSKTEVDNAVAGATMSDSSILSAVKRVDGSGSGLDADTLDGLQAGSFLRSDATDYINNNLILRGDIVGGDDGYRDHGVYGNYDSYKTDHIWSMGTVFRNDSSGANFGNLYGLAYKHTNNSTGGTMAGGHQMVWCQNGSPKAAMGDGIWTSGNVTASSYYGNGSNLTGVLGDSGKSFSTNGYQKLSNGLIIQWGSTPSRGGVTFPIAFPSAVSSLAISRSGNTSNDGNNVPEYSSLSTTGFYYACGISGKYIAIGY